ncbi:hypothetical protein A4R26_24650 [Niastella populi]|uniref:Uncharacterized protein n=1 Tax=Niastella populi TaxID=550983 RepID=A0A1V9FGL3_9BACT|nr:hypothetical protein A4R26_24650 [Niastella populi]
MTAFTDPVFTCTTYLIFPSTTLKTTHLKLLNYSVFKIWQNDCYMFRGKRDCLRIHMHHIAVPAT